MVFKLYILHTQNLQDNWNIVKSLINSYNVLQLMCDCRLVHYYIKSNNTRLDHLNVWKCGMLYLGQREKSNNTMIHYDIIYSNTYILSYVVRFNLCVQNNNYYTWYYLLFYFLEIYGCHEVTTHQFPWKWFCLFKIDSWPYSVLMHFLEL